MATYQLHIKIDQGHVKQFNQDGFRLCFASGVNDASGKTNYNVIASTQTVGGNVIVQWVDEYAIAASQSAFQDGVQFTATTDPVGISFGQSFTCPHDFTDTTPNDDSSASRAGFSFINQAEKAAAVVYKKVQGTFSAIYISKHAPLPPGREDLIPVEKVAVWFAADAETSTMISNFASAHFEIDYTGNQSRSASIAYSAQGTWSTIN